MEKKVETNGGGGKVLLTITLVILKALGYIDFPWIWVFAPTWIPLAIALVMFLFAGILILIDRFFG